MNVFDCAIKRKEDSSKNYEKLATITAVPELKTLFTILAASEQEHRDALEKMKSNLDSEGITFHALQDATCQFTDLLDQHALMTELKEDYDAYRHVIKEEEDGIRFYKELAAQTENEGARRILLSIADEERKHLSIVENIYFFVESPKNYLANAEFSNLKKYD